MEFGLIGEHLGHSYSRELHERIGGYPYKLRELRPDELGVFLQKRDFRGVNVTIPYKQAVIPFLDEISDTAHEIGAVNTIVNRGGRLIGYNTDYAGLLALARHSDISVSGKKALILGTGGASKTAFAVMKVLGAREIQKVSRRKAPDTVTYAEAAEIHSDADIIVNTTPVGMFPNADSSPIDLAAFPKLSGVLDAVYHPLRTELVLDARMRGIPAEGGLYMLCAQAVRAAELFLGREFDPALTESAFQALKSEKENLVLIGMPTCGKTTVGRLLARETGRPFADTDALLAMKIGSVPDYIRANGEAAFRALERETVSEISRESGYIIATGGGVILSPENLRALRRNGRLIFLDRSLQNLRPSPNRPLSSTPEKLRALYETRYPLYRAAADLIVPANRSAEEVADDIRKELLG